MAPFDGAAASDPDFLGLVDNAYVNSLLYTLECRLILAVIALRNSGSTYLKT